MIAHSLRRWSGDDPLERLDFQGKLLAVIGVFMALLIAGLIYLALYSADTSQDAKTIAEDVQTLQLRQADTQAGLTGLTNALLKNGCQSLPERQHEIKLLLRDPSVSAERKAYYENTILPGVIDRIERLDC